jgi:hypothetical protein
LRQKALASLKLHDIFVRTAVRPALQRNPID